MSEAPTEPGAKKPRDWFVIIVVVVLVVVIAAVVAWALFGAVKHTYSQNMDGANIQRSRTFTSAACRFPNAYDGRRLTEVSQPG
jgi:flagellar basal body-associated protein FliL